MAGKNLSKLLSDMQDRVSDIRQKEISDIGAIRVGERSEAGGILSRKIKINQEFLDRKSDAEKRKNQLNVQFADATGKVLNEDTLRFLDTHANISAPTFTSIFAGFERARASRAERRERALVRTVQGIDVGLGISAERAKFELSELTTELKDVRSNADELVKAIESGANADVSIEKFKVQELNRRGSGTSTEAINLQGLLDAAGNASVQQSTTDVQAPAVTPDQRLANIVVQPSNIPLFDGLGIPEDKRPLAQLAYDAALESPLNKIDPNYAASFVARGFQESAFDSDAVGGAGEQGLYQLKPSTAAEVGVINSFDPADNINGALKYDVANATRLRNAGVEVNIRNIGSAFNAGPGATIENGGETVSAQEYLNRIDANTSRLSSLVTSTDVTAQPATIIEPPATDAIETPPVQQVDNQDFVSTGDDLPDINNLPPVAEPDADFVSTGNDLPDIEQIIRDREEIAAFDDERIEKLTTQQRAIDDAVRNSEPVNLETLATDSGLPVDALAPLVASGLVTAVPEIDQVNQQELDDARNRSDMLQRVVDAGEPVSISSLATDLNIDSAALQPLIAQGILIQQDDVQAPLNEVEKLAQSMGVSVESLQPLIASGLIIPDEEDQST